ncbi:hypothetical protein [Devosia sp. 1635]|uniref:hypothetical protein n=1 Tax=Devosia sp. 1635 TaxID=2726066 RepID=UPI001564E4B3|nr:hypothetical protein [Devosia sp. 1635]
MRTDYLLKRVRELFTGSSKAVGFAAATSASSPRVNDIAGLVSHIRARNSTAVMAGCVLLVGLDEIRARVGEGWNTLADRATGIAEEVLQQFLGPQDVFQRLPSGAFQVCFETQDEAFAHFQVQRIAARIEERIKLELQHGAPMVSVESFAAAVDSQRFTETSDPLAALHASLLDIRDQVSDRSAKRHRITALRYASALFQPLWPSRAFGKTINRSLLDSWVGTAAAEHLTALESRDELLEALANLDCVLFAKSVEGLHQALGDIKQASVMVPVQFQTLLGASPEFIELGAALPPPYRKFLLLDVIGVPSAASALELLQVVRTAREITERVVLQVTPWDDRLNDGVRGATWGLSISLGEAEGENLQMASELERFGREARLAGLASFAYGANTIGKAEAAYSAQFNYLGGAAVHSTLATPRSHARFAPLFGDRLPSSAAGDDRAELRAHPRFVPLNTQALIFLPDGRQTRCRIANVSASGAVVLTFLALGVGDYLAIGAIGAQVVRVTRGGFAVQFLEVQQAFSLESALQAKSIEPRLLKTLQELGADRLGHRNKA